MFIGVSDKAKSSFLWVRRKRLPEILVRLSEHGKKYGSNACECYLVKRLAPLDSTV
jgi:hypothetical protein